MDPEMWDAYAAKFGQALAVEKLGPRPAPPSAEPTPEDAALARTNARGGNALTDFLAQMRHGVTLGFDDDIADAIKPGAGAEIRQRIADRRLLNPGASMLGEIAGGAALPVGAGGTAMRGGKGLLSAIGRGAVVGGVQGGLMGAGEATGTVGERMEAAVPSALAGAAIGGAVGTLPGLLNAAVRRAPGRGARVAGELTEATGLSGDINAVRDANEAAVRAARAQHYAPLDQLGKVDDPGIDAWFTARGLAAKPRTLQELQTVVKNTRDKVAAADLRSRMQQAFAGLDTADRAYGQAVRPQAAERLGSKMVNRPAADIERAQRGLLSTGEQTAFRQGELYRVLSNLQKRDEGSVEMLRRFMDAGPETKAQLRTMFPDDEAFNRFLAVLRREESAEKVIAQLPRAAMLAALGGGGYVGARWNSP